MSTPDGYVEFDNTVVRDESEEAIEVELDDGRKFWIPKSQVHDDSESYELGTDGSLVVAEWLADRKGMT